MSSLTLKLLTLLLLLSLAGCGYSPVAEDVSQREANEIVSLLSSYGINASVARETGGRGRYAVQVDKSVNSQARVLMQANDLPHATEVPFNDLVAQQGLIPNSRELEAARLDRALALEIETLLLNHPKIVAAKAVVRSNLLKASGESSVSVIAQRKVEVSTPENPVDTTTATPPGSALEEEITTIVANAIPNLKRENVRVSIQETPGRKEPAQIQHPNAAGTRLVTIPLVPFLGWWHLPPDEIKWLYVALLAICAVLVAAGGFLGYWYGFFRQSRQYFEGETPELNAPIVSAALRLDRGGKKDPNSK